MFLHNFIPNTILFDLGIITIHWYGLILVVAVASGFLIFLSLSRASPENSGRADVKSRGDHVALREGPCGTISDNFFINLFFYTTVWSIIGGRLFHVLTFLNYYLQNPLEIFYIWQGGISFYGVFIFGVASLFYFSGKLKNKNKIIQEYKNIKICSRRKNIFIFLYFYIFRKEGLINFLFLLDIAAPALALAQSIGRWGNWFNQELFGLPCNFSWCIPIEFINRPVGFEQFSYFHPTFLYESILMFMVFILLFKAYKKIYSSPIALISDKDINNEKGVANNNVTMKQCNNETICHNTIGVIFATYLVLHASIRFILEFLRLDPQPILLGLRLFQWFAFVEFIIGMVLVFVLKKWYNKSTGTLEQLNT